MSGQPPLTRIRFKNWRSLRDVTIDNLTPITVFVGANSSGKTNIFSALQFLRDAETKGEIEAAYQWRVRDKVRTMGIGDLDAEVQHVQNKKAYGEIERICRDEGVILIIADDKIEAWMLADQGLCAWLDFPVNSWDGKPRVKDELEHQLRKAYPKMRYGGRDRDKIIANLDGTGSEKSPSMQAACDQLTASACI